MCDSLWEKCKMVSITWCSSSGSSWAGFFDGGDLSEVDRLPCARGIVYGLHRSRTNIETDWQTQPYIRGR